jgi:periplasmic copper chaperone A
MVRFSLIVAATCGALILSPALAHDFSVGNLKIAHPWARATPKGASVGGGYLTITNTGTASDRLIGGSSDVAGQFELHSMTMENGVMKMRPVTGGVEIKPGETVKLAPGGYHVMFVGLKKPLEKDQHVDATLEFAKAGKVKVYFLVEGIGATHSGDSHAMPGMGGDHAMPGMKH